MKRCVREKIIYLSARRPRESLETLRMSPRDSVEYAAVKITEKPRLHHQKYFMASVYNVYTPVQSFQYHLNNNKHNRLEKKIVQQKEVKFCLNCYVSSDHSGQFDMIHHVSTSDHIWKILIHNLSKKVIDQVNM